LENESAVVNDNFFSENFLRLFPDSRVWVGATRKLNSAMLDLSNCRWLKLSARAVWPNFDAGACSFETSNKCQLQSRDYNNVTELGTRSFGLGIAPRGIDDWIMPSYGKGIMYSNS
jgi:hypothetical protein